MNLLGTNQKLLQTQQLQQTRGGQLLKNIFSISARYPLPSVIFVLAFGVFTNTAFETISYFVAESSYRLLDLLLLDIILILLMAMPYALIWWRHRDLVKPLPITQKKALITMASDREDYTESSSFGVYEAILYRPGRHAARNALEQVVVIASENPGSQKMAAELVRHIKDSGRSAIVKNIQLENNDVEEVKQQIDLIIKGCIGEYKPYEILADYTGGTKIMSIALYVKCEQRLITPVYFTEAMTRNHSKFASSNDKSQESKK